MVDSVKCSNDMSLLLSCCLFPNSLFLPLSLRLTIAPCLCFSTWWPYVQFHSSIQTCSHLRACHSSLDQACVKDRHTRTHTDTQSTQSGSNWWPTNRTACKHPANSLLHAFGIQVLSHSLYFHKVFYTHVLDLFRFI